MDNILNMMQAQFDCACRPTEIMFQRFIGCSTILCVSLRALARLAKTMGQVAKLPYDFGKGYMSAVKLASLDEF